MLKCLAFFAVLIIDQSRSIDWFLHDGNTNLKLVKTIIKMQFKAE